MNIQQKADYTKSLLQQITIQEDLILLSEADICFQNNALRSAYIMTWIAITEFLKKRIHDYESIGDVIAQTAVKEIADYEKQKKSTDKLIIDRAKACYIVDEIEFANLEYFWHNRCIYAHPYETKPSEEDVIHIFKAAVNIMSKPVYYRKAYIDVLVNDLKNKLYLYPADLQSIRNKAKIILSRIEQSSYQRLFKTLLYELGTNIEDFKLADNTASIRFRGFLLELLLASNEDNLKDYPFLHRAENFPLAFWCGLVHNDTWMFFSPDVKDVLFRYLDSKECTNPGLIIVYSNILIKKGLIEEQYLPIYDKNLSRYSFKVSAIYYRNSSDIYNKLIELLWSYEYPKNDEAIEYLREANFDIFTNEQLMEIGKHLIRASRNNSFNVINYLNTFITENNHICLTTGLISGMFFMDSNINIRPGTLKKHFRPLTSSITANKTRLDYVKKYFEQQLAGGEINAFTSPVELNRLRREQIEKMTEAIDIELTNYIFDHLIRYSENVDE